MPANPGIGSVIAISLAPDELDKLIHGTYTNYGWLLKMDTENSDRHDYASSSSTTLSNRPKLVIEYSTAADVPEEWTNRTYTYSLSQPHAVIADSTGATYGYDSNGNMTSRVEGGRHYQQSYNAEHQLSQVQLLNNQTLLATWNFFFDGDGSRVRQEYFEGTFGQNVVVKVTNYYAGGTYELDQAGIVQADGSILISGTITRKYYAFAGQTVAMVECSPQGCGSGLKYFLTDTLGSVVAVINASGGLISQQRYYPYGGVRSDVGSVSQTDFGYTGQRNLDEQGNSYRLGLMDYKARFYDPYLHHFIQPDSVVPDGNPQSLNRYSYVNNRPIVAADPSGHRLTECGSDSEECRGYGGGIPIIPTNPITPEDYGVTLSGWKPEYEKVIMQEIAQIAWKLLESYNNYCSQNEISCQSYDQFGIFKAVFGNQEVVYDSSNPGACNANGAAIVCGELAEWGPNMLGEIWDIGTDPSAKLYHQITAEFGHKFFAHFNGPNDPAQELYQSVFFSDGSRSGEGYQYNGNVQPYVHHKIDDSSGCWSACEDIADMYMNWIYDSFEPDLWGYMRYGWMNDRMGEWVYSIAK